jgi:hypothetical protein
VFDQLPGISSQIITLTTIVIVIICNLLIWHKTRQNLLPEQQRSVEISRQVGRVLLNSGHYSIYAANIAINVLPADSFYLS